MTELIQSEYLSEQIVDLLDSLPNPADIRDIAELNGPINQLSTLANRLDDLPYDQVETDLRERVTEQLRRFYDKRERLREIKKAGEQVERLIGDAQRMHASGLAIDRIKEVYDDALALVYGLKSRDWDEGETVAVALLEGRATTARQEYLNDHEIPTTRQGVDTLAAQILVFAERAESDPTYEVTYFEHPAFDAPMVRMPVSRALDLARLILFNFWDAKTVEYVELARQKLEIDHLPREALGELARFDQLPGLNNAKIGVTVSDEARGQVATMRDLIRQEIEKLNAAERELRHANRILGTEPPDALEAHKHYLLAEQKYPFAPDLETTRGHIVKTAGNEIAPLLDTTETRLKREVWVEAERGLERLARLLDLQPVTSMTDERARFDRLLTAYEDVRPLVARGPEQARMNPTTRRERLEELRVTYGDTYWPGWKSLAHALSQLQALRNLDAIEGRISKARSTSAPVADLEELVESLEDLLENPPPNTPADKLSQLAPALRQIKSWLGYARARDELKKAPVRGVNVSTNPDDLYLDEVADLQVVEEGLQAAEGDRKAGEAARGLKAQYDQLKKNNGQAAAVLKEARRLLDSESGTRPLFEELLKNLARELGRPTSHRQELLIAYREVRERLITYHRDELRRLLSGARNDYYAELREDDLEERIRQLNELEQVDRSNPDGAKDELKSEAQLAQLIARANRIERDIKINRKKPWESAQDAWNSVFEKAEKDEEMRQHAHQRERLAHKQIVIRKATTRSGATQSDAAERDATYIEQLKQLTEDPYLRDDWEVWYQYGSFLFAQARKAMTPDKDQDFTEHKENLNTARGWINTARLSFDSADRLLGERGPTEDPDEITDANRLQQSARSIEEWDILLEAFNFYQDTVTNPNPQPADFLRMTRLHQNTNAKLARAEGSNSSAKSRHDYLWGQARGYAREILEGRLNLLPSGEILGRLNILLSLIILFPDDDVIRRHFGAQADQTLNALQTLFDETVNDYGGANFSRRYQAREDRSADPKTLLALQLKEARETAAAVAGYRNTLELTEIADFANSTDLVARMAGELNRWVAMLDAFRAALDAAEKLADDGLSQPEGFDKAYHILREGQSRHTELDPVPQEFVDANHPTYRWMVDKIGRENARLKGQQEFHRQITEMIAKEKAALELVVRSRNNESLTESEQNEINQLPKLLNELREALSRMRETEPDDPTLLQTSLRYPLPENSERLYRGAESIETIVAHKLEQYRLINNWLSRWVDSGGRLQNVIDWAGQKRGIALRRDRGPGNIGLNPARQQCNEALHGVGDTGKVGGQWALQPAHDALSPAAMRRALWGDEPPPGQDQQIYGLVEPLNRRRAALQQTLAEQIAENKTIENNIIWRIGNFQLRFDTLMAEKDRLLDTRKAFWKVWNEYAAYRDFQKAVADFCEICPDYSTFQQILDEARKHTGMNFYCGDEEQNATPNS